MQIRDEIECYLRDTAKDHDIIDAVFTDVPCLEALISVFQDSPKYRAIYDKWREDNA